MRLSSCTRCGKEIRISPSQEGRKHFCSISCSRPGKVTLSCQLCGKKYQRFPAYAERSKFCSRKCGNKAIAIRQTSRATHVRICPVCGEHFLSTSHHGGKITCSPACRRKRQNDGLKKAKMAFTPGTSRFEDRIASWLTSQGISYKRQKRVGGLWCVDFLLDDGTVIEAQGCYWHGCPCRKRVSPDAKKRASKDKGLATYCRNRGIRLITIWEHEDLNHSLSLFFR